MKKTGAWLAKYALEQVGVKFTFGIPGVHNTELYDELNNSPLIEPLLVTHEGGGAFMADAVSRTTNHIGCMVIVPAAGVTHAASGIAEAHLDGIPMLVISGGVRTDTGRAYQLHDMDQHALLKPITKATFKVTCHEAIIETIYKAYDIATQGEPGPVFIELPVNLQLFSEQVSGVYPYENKKSSLPVDHDSIQQAAQLLCAARQPGIFAGWGGRDASESLIELAQWLASPVATTLQGLSVFPANHPLHVGMGMGGSAVPAAENAFKKVDCLLAIGTRFSEIPTGSYGINVPQNLIHLDINPNVFSANYPAKVCLEGDAKVLLPELLAAVKKILLQEKNSDKLSQLIQQDKLTYQKEWDRHDSGKRVNPALFFKSLRSHLNHDDYVVCDDGNHTFLTAELMAIHKSRHFIAPTDFNCMGYGVPATIATKLTHKDKNVVGIVGDGAFLMTCMELITAAKYGIAPIICVFNDGELSQIAQAQEIPYNRKTCSVLGGLDIAGVATATGARYVALQNNQDIEGALQTALRASQQGQAVIVDVKVDYSKRTRFTQGTVKTNLKRFDLKTKTRFIGRALVRKVTG